MFWCISENDSFVRKITNALAYIRMHVFGYNTIFTDTFFSSNACYNVLELIQLYIISGLKPKLSPANTPEFDLILADSGIPVVVDIR